MPANRIYKRHEIAAIAAVKAFIDNHPVDNKNTTELADMMQINRNKLVQGFKKSYGTGIKEYRVRLRLEFAKRLLEEGKPEKWIAIKCLYASQSTFCTAFKRVFGMTPTDWQKSFA